MNTYYGNKLVKFISPINNEIFTLELGGDENELRELIGTIINYPSHSIKGIKDCFGNYYTLSSAIKNPNLTCDFSSYYFIVINQSSFITQTNKQSLMINGISPIRKNTSTNENYQQLAFWIDNNSSKKYLEIAEMLYEKKFVDENKLRKIKQLIYEENEEIFTLFTLFTKNGKDLKKLHTQLGPIIENTQTNFENNETTISQRTGGLSKKGSKRDSSYNNTVLNAIIDSIEDQFESKNDLKVVKRLILCDNESVLRALEEYEIDGDQKKLVNTLNFLIIKYRKRLSKSHPSFNPQASILDLKVNSSPEEENKSLNEEELNQLFTKIIKKIKKKLTSCTNLIRFDYSSIFLFDIETMNNEQKRTLFFDVFNINPDDPSLSSSFVDDINKYYKAIVQNKILSDLNIQEIQIYNLLIEQKDAALIEIFEDNMKKHNIEGLKKKIKKYIQQIMQDNIKEGNEDEEDEKSSSVPSVSKEESSGYIIKKKNQKEKTTSILNISMKKKNWT